MLPEPFSDLIPAFQIVKRTVIYASGMLLVPGDSSRVCVNIQLITGGQIFIYPKRDIVLIPNGINIASGGNLNLTLKDFGPWICEEIWAGGAYAGNIHLILTSYRPQ